MTPSATTIEPPTFLTDQEIQQPGVGDLTFLPAEASFGTWKVRVPKEFRVRITFGNESFTTLGITTSQMPGWVEAILPEILHLESLGEDWDSYGGRAPTSLWLEKVIAVLCRSELEAVPLPSVVPTPSGGVQLEWASAEGDFELAFFPDGSVSYLATKADGTSPEEDLFAIQEIDRVRRALSMVRG